MGEPGFAAVGKEAAAPWASRRRRARPSRLPRSVRSEGREVALRARERVAERLGTGCVEVVSTRDVALPAERQARHSAAALASKWKTGVPSRHLVLWCRRGTPGETPRRKPGLAGEWISTRTRRCRLPRRADGPRLRSRSSVPGSRCRGRLPASSSRACSCRCRPTSSSRTADPR